VTTAGNTSQPAGPTDRRHATGPLASLRLALADIKLAHTVFAMPFAVLGAAVALADRGGIDPAEAALLLTLVVIAMVFARSWAMLINRIADRRFDATNPRTARRALPAGDLTPKAAWTIALASALLFTLTAIAFYSVDGNLWPAVLALPVLAWIALYSYTKRFTALAHFFLGSALAISPLCAALAVHPQTFGLNPDLTTAITAGAWTDSATALTCIAAFVALWVAGFDIAYALQDIEHDRSLKLKSIPAKLGTRHALWLSRLCHAPAIATLAAAAIIEHAFSTITACAVAAVAALLVYEHLVLHKRGTAGLPLAFFTVNGVISCTLAAAAITDLIL